MSESINQLCGVPQLSVRNCANNALQSILKFRTSAEIIGVHRVIT
jgi:hypothetical protein